MREVSEDWPGTIYFRFNYIPHRNALSVLARGRLSRADAVNDYPLSKVRLPYSLPNKPSIYVNQRSVVSKVFVNQRGVVCFYQLLFYLQIYFL